VLKAMREHSYLLLQDSCTVSQLADARRELKELLASSFSRA
jgi:hypothetical protein